MGIVAPKPPRPRTATHAEMQADLDAIVAEIHRYRVMTAIVMCAGLIVAVAIAIVTAAL